MSRDRPSMIIESHDVTDQLAKLSGKWVLYLAHSTLDDAIEELAQAVPFLDHDAAIRLLGSSIWLVYDDEVSALAAFALVVGDEQNKRNPYRGPARVYAYLAGPSGGIGENT